MNEQTARENGLVFTGSYERSKEPGGRLQKTLKEIRSQKYLAYIVTVPDSPLSRGTIGKGYSIYTEARYMLDKQAEGIRTKIQYYPNLVESANKRHQVELGQVYSERNTQERWLTDHGYKL